MKIPRHANPAHDQPIVHLPEDGCMLDAQHDVRFQQRRLREMHGRDGGVLYPGSVHWLDRAMDAYEQALSFATLEPLKPRVALPEDHAFHEQPLFLYIEMPHARYPVLHEESLYQRLNTARRSSMASDGAHGGAGAGAGAGSGGGGSSSGAGGDPRVTGHAINVSTWLKRLEENETYAEKVGQFSNSRDEQTSLNHKMMRFYHPYTPAPRHQFTRLTAENNSRQWTQSLAVVVDHSFSPATMASSPSSSATSSATSPSSTFTSFSPVEAMYAKLSRGNETRGHANPQLLKPDKSEREAIARIVALPNDDLGQAERQLLWRFRYSLVSEGNAIVKFVLIVDWNGDVDEARLGEELLSKWAPIGADSALKLLSARFKQVAPVRRHAIKALSKLPDDELCLYLLQLVQALRYEDLPPPQESVSNTAGEGETPEPERGGSISTPITAAVTIPSAAATTTSHDTADSLSDHDRALSACPLLRFLAQRATTSVELATLLHWYLTVETEDTKMGPHFERILDIVARTLKTSGGR